MSKVQKWGYGSFGVGLVLAVVFFVLYGVTSTSDTGLKSAYLAAATICVVAGANGLGAGVADSVKTGKWVGLIVGAVAFVGWGIVWLADSSTVKASFGWAAVFGAIGAVASLLPELFGGSSAPAATSSN
jgi:hypothetical protein